MPSVRFVSVLANQIGRERQTEPLPVRAGRSCVRCGGADAAKITLLKQIISGRIIFFQPTERFVPAQCYHPDPRIGIIKGLVPSWPEFESAVSRKCPAAQRSRFWSRRQRTRRSVTASILDAQCHFFLNLTPAPPPFSGMNSTPADSSAARKVAQGFTRLSVPGV
jgi:hypothetical protein